MDGGFQILNKDMFYERIKKRKLTRWPLDSKTGKKFGRDLFNDEKEFEKFVKSVSAEPVSLVRISYYY